MKMNLRKTFQDEIYKYLFSNITTQELPLITREYKNKRERITFFGN